MVLTTLQSANSLGGVHSYSMAGLADLPTELLEQIFLHQDAVEDMLSLGSSSIRLHQVLTQPRIWRNLLAKANLITVVKKKMKDPPGIRSSSRLNRSLIQKLMVFLKATEHGELLLSLLRDNTCQFHPGSTNGPSVSVSLPLQPGPRCVSVLGLLLLAYTEGQGQGPTILTVKMVLGPGTHTVTAQGVGLQVGEEQGNRISPGERGPPASLLGALACLVSLQEEPVSDLEVTSTISCSTEEEGRALAHLLESSTSWRLRELVLEGGVGREAWQGLGRAAGQGRLEEVRTGRRVMGRGKKEDVRRVWESTRGDWVVDGRQQGWGEIEPVFTTGIQKVKRILCLSTPESILILLVVILSAIFLCSLCFAHFRYLDVTPKASFTSAYVAFFLSVTLYLIFVLIFIIYIVSGL